jgi:hypothetical protein
MKMSKRIIGRENAVEALASLCGDYRGTALRAIRQGGEYVYIPADTRDPDSMLAALSDPEGKIQFESQGNHSQKEPCYASLNEFLEGKNADRTPHGGYLLVDIVAKLVTDLCDREGRSVVPTIRPLNPQKLAKELMGIPDSYCL